MPQPRPAPALPLRFATVLLLAAGCQGSAAPEPLDGPILASRQAVCSAATLTSSPSGSATAGATVVWTAGATCQFANPQYAFLVRDAITGTWSYAQNYSTASTYTWQVPSVAPGSAYSWQVWVRESGSSVSYETWAGASLTVASGTCTGISSTPSPTGPAPIGTPVSITSSATGCTDPQYQVLHLPPGGTWQTVQPYGASATYPWSTTGAPTGTHTFQVWARQYGNAGAYDVYDTFTYNLVPAVCSAVTTIVSPPTEATVGASVTLSSSATGCPSAVYEVWHLPPGGAWTALQAYSPSASTQWNTTSEPAGTHAFQVWARENGSGNGYESYDSFSYALTAPCPGGCPAGKTCCATTCVDTTSDASNCGTCGQTCPSGTCAGGACSCTSDASCPAGDFCWLGGCEKLRAVAAGYEHTCAVTTTGGVQCWGYNGFGALGNGMTPDSHVPVAVTGLSSGVTAIAAGVYHTCALTKAGGVQCWGYNVYGQLGNGTTMDSHIPVAVSGLSSGVVAIAAGGDTTCALTAAGGVQCWGYNGYGGLGNGTTTDSHVPVGVSGLTSGVGAIAAGAYHVCAVTLAGGVQCWGWNQYGQLGNNATVNSPVPVGVSGLSSGAVAVAAGYAFTCALTTGGGVQCWGGNSTGQLGNGSTTDSHVPVAVSGLSSGVGAIAAGSDDTCVVTTGGGAQCWGYNGDGELGNNATTNSSVPAGVSGATSGVATMALGYFHTCALTLSGAGECWGSNTFGQLGNGSTTNSLVPIGVVEP